MFLRRRPFGVGGVGRGGSRQTAGGRSPRLVARSNPRRETPTPRLPTLPGQAVGPHRKDLFQPTQNRRYPAQGTHGEKAVCRRYKNGRRRRQAGRFCRAARIAPAAQAVRLMPARFAASAISRFSSAVTGTLTSTLSIFICHLLPRQFDAGERMPRFPSCRQS